MPRLNPLSSSCISQSFGKPENIRIAADLFPQTAGTEYIGVTAILHVCVGTLNMLRAFIEPACTFRKWDGKNAVELHMHAIRKR